MKRKILLSFAAALCAAGLSTAQAADTPTVWLDGEQLTFDVAPIIQNDRTMVPYRAIFEELGYTVSWNAQNQSVSAIKGSSSMWMQIGNKNITVNGSNVVSDTAPFIQGDRTLVPLRLVSEYSGCDVLWNGETETVAMYHKQAKNAMSEKIGCVTTDGASLLVERRNAVTEECGTQGYSLTDLSAIALIPRFLTDTACDGVAYGRLRPDWSIHQWEALCSVNMKNGNILSSIDLRNLNDPRISYSGSSFILDPVYKELYLTGYDETAQPTLYRVDKTTLEILEAVPVPREVSQDQYIDCWAVHDRKLFVSIREYNLEKHRDVYDCYLADLDSGKVLYHPDTDAITQGLFYGEELYLLDNSSDNVRFLIYNYKTNTLRTIQMPNSIESFDLVANGIFYTTDDERSLYRMTLEGELPMKIADSIGTDFKIVGNTVYYLAYADTSDYQWYEDKYDQVAVRGWDSIYAMPTCGGTPYLLERRISVVTPMS